MLILTTLFMSRLAVQSQSLDIVYNPSATKWLIDFFTKPHQTHSSQLRQAARHGYNAMKQRTRKELLKNWENILRGSVVEVKLQTINSYYDFFIRAYKFSRRIARILRILFNCFGKKNLSERYLFLTL